MTAETCVGYDARSRRPCTRPAVEVVTAACIHEHIGQRSLCGWHAGDVREGRMRCGDCQDCSNPHMCDLVPAPTRRTPACPSVDDPKSSQVNGTPPQEADRG